MNYVALSELRRRASDIWRRVEAGEEFVVTRNGKPIALLVRAEPSTVEYRSRALRLARISEVVSAIQADARASGASLLTEEEIQAEIDAVRRARLAAAGLAPSARDLPAGGG